MPPEIAKLFDTARSSAPRHVSRILAPHLASRNLLREPEKETERERVTAFDDETGINAENCSSHWAGHFVIRLQCYRRIFTDTTYIVYDGILVVVSVFRANFVAA